MRMNINLQQLVHVMQKKDKKYDQLENLTSTISHEMRTPLGIIMQTSQRMTNLLSSDDYDLRKLLMMIFY